MSHIRPLQQLQLPTVAGLVLPGPTLCLTHYCYVFSTIVMLAKAMDSIEQTTLSPVIPLKQHIAGLRRHIRNEQRAEVRTRERMIEQ